MNTLNQKQLDNHSEDLNTEKELNNKKYPVATRILGFIIYCFFSILFGTMVAEIANGVMLLFIPVIMVPLIRYFNVVIAEDNQWTIAYTIFCICSVIWMFQLAEWRGGENVSDASMIFFEIGNVISLLLAMIFTPSRPSSKWMVRIFCAVWIIGTIYRTNLISFIQKSLL